MGLIIHIFIHIFPGFGTTLLQSSVDVIRGDVGNRLGHFVYVTFRCAQPIPFGTIGVMYEWVLYRRYNHPR